MGPSYRNRETSRTISRSRGQKARAAVAKAAQLLRARSATPTGSYAAPATRGWYGGYAARGRPELKFVDVQLQNSPITITWSVQLINGVVQGTDYNQRIGRKVVNKSLLFNGNISMASGNNISNAQGTFCRVVVIYDSQPNSGTIPAGTDIFAFNDPNSPMNLNNRDRFKVVIDKRCQVGAFLTSGGGTLATGSPNDCYWSKYKKMNMETIFSNTAATLGSISTGSLYVCYVSDFATTTILDFVTRVRYLDN